MNKFPDYNAIKNFYDLKLWTDDMLKDAVKFEAITAEQFKEITQTDYTA